LVPLARRRPGVKNGCGAARDVRRQVARHVGKLGALGFEVTLCRIPEPSPDGMGQTQAV
jgi:hypothetical protein